MLKVTKRISSKYFPTALEWSFLPTPDIDGLHILIHTFTIYIFE